MPSMVNEVLSEFRPDSIKRLEALNLRTGALGLFNKNPARENMSGQFIWSRIGEVKNKI